MLIGVVTELTEDHWVPGKATTLSLEEKKEESKSVVDEVAFVQYKIIRVKRKPNGQSQKKSRLSMVIVLDTDWRDNVNIGAQYTESSQEI